MKGRQEKKHDRKKEKKILRQKRTVDKKQNAEM